MRAFSSIFSGLFSFFRSSQANQNKMFSSLYSHRKNSRKTLRPLKLDINLSKDSDHDCTSAAERLLKSSSLGEQSSVGLGGFTLKPTSHSIMDHALPILSVLLCIRATGFTFTRTCHTCRTCHISTCGNVASPLVTCHVLILSPD